jgi:hypothetical protein
MNMVHMDRAATGGGSIRGLLDRGVYYGHLHIDVLHSNAETIAIQNLAGVYLMHLLVSSIVTTHVLENSSLQKAMLAEPFDATSEFSYSEVLVQASIRI